MITVGGGTGINFSSKRAKDSKNGTAGGQFGVAGTVEAAKVKIYPSRVVFGLGRGRPIAVFGDRQGQEKEGSQGH